MVAIHLDSGHFRDEVLMIFLDPFGHQLVEKGAHPWCRTNDALALVGLRVVRHAVSGPFGMKHGKDPFGELGSVLTAYAHHMGGYGDRQGDRYLLNQLAMSDRYSTAS